jgi:hypothetical protein
MPWNAGHDLLKIKFKCCAVKAIVKLSGCLFIDGTTLRYHNRAFIDCHKLMLLPTYLNFLFVLI